MAPDDDELDMSTQYLTIFLNYTAGYLDDVALIGFRTQTDHLSRTAQEKIFRLFKF